MITVVSGKLGSGKSYDCVRLVRTHLANGGCVRTNIRLDYKEIGLSVGRRLSPNQIGPLTSDMDPTTIPIGDKRGHGKRRTIVLLDEALNWFQSEGSKGVDEKKRAWGEWLRQSDKLGQDVYFIAQNFDRAAKWIRELAQVNRLVTALKSVRLFTLVPMWWVFPFVRKSYIVTSWDVQSGAQVGIELHRYSPRIWKLYDTSETFGFQACGSAYDNLNLWPRYAPPIRGISLASFVSLCTVAINIFYMWKLA